MPEVDIEKIDSIRKGLITEVDNILRRLHERLLENFNSNEVHRHKVILSQLITKSNKTIQNKFNLFFEQIWEITDLPKYIEQLIRYILETNGFIATLISQRMLELESYPNDTPHIITDMEILCIREDLFFRIFEYSTSLTTALFISPIIDSQVVHLRNDTETSALILSISGMFKALERYFKELNMSMCFSLFKDSELYTIHYLNESLTLDNHAHNSEITSVISRYQHEINGVIGIANCIINTFHNNTFSNIILRKKILLKMHSQLIQETAFQAENPRLIASKMTFIDSVDTVIKELDEIYRQEFIATLNADDHFSLSHKDFPLAFISEKDVRAISNTLMDSLYQYHLLEKSDFEIRVAMFKFRQMLIDLDRQLRIPISFIKNRSDNHHDFFQSIQNLTENLRNSTDTELMQFETYQITTKLISDRIHTVINHSVKIFVSTQKELMLRLVFQAVSNHTGTFHKSILGTFIVKNIDFAINSIEPNQSYQDTQNMLVMMQEWSSVLTEFYKNSILLDNPETILLELKKLNAIATSKPEPFQIVIFAINQIVLDRLKNIEVRSRLRPLIGKPKTSYNTAHSQILFDLKQFSKRNKIKRLLTQSDTLNSIFHDLFERLEKLIGITSQIFETSQSLEANGISFDHFCSIPYPKYQNKSMTFSRADALTFRSLLPRYRMPESNPYYDYLNEKAREYLNRDTLNQTQYEYERLRAQLEYYASSHRVYLSKNTINQKLKLLRRYYKEHHHKWARNDSLSKLLKILIPLTLLIVFLFSTSSLLVLACAVLNHGLLHSINIILYLSQRIVFSGLISLLPITGIIVASIVITILTKNILQKLFLSADEKQAKHHFTLMTKLIQHINHNAPIIKDAVIIESEVFEEPDQLPSMNMFKNTFTEFAKSRNHNHTDFFKTRLPERSDSEADAGAGVGVGVGVGQRDNGLQIRT